MIMNMRQDDAIAAELDDSKLDALGNDGIHASPSSWRALFVFTSELHTIHLAMTILLSALSGIVIPALAIFLGKLFEAFTNYEEKLITGPGLITTLSSYGLGLVALGCTSGFLNASFFISWLVFGELQAKKAREKIFDSMLCKDMEWYDTRMAGVRSLISRLQTRIRELQMAVSQPLGFLVQYVVTAIAALGLAVYYSWNLTLVILATMPVSAVILNWLSKRMQPAIETHAERLTQAVRLATNAITAIETVKCLNGQELELSQYTREVEDAARINLVQAQANALQVGFARFVILAMFVQGFWYGSHLVNIGLKTPGDILTCFWACLIATQTIEQISPQIVLLEKGRAAGATLKAATLKMEDDEESPKMIGIAAPLDCKGDIEVKNVSFSYPTRPDELALNNASFFFAAGRTTFVVGASGSGKSTLSNLLIRFYNPRSGDILIDGYSIQTLDVSWIRNNVTLVQQQSVLFTETIFNNIAYGKKCLGAPQKIDIERAIDLSLLQHTIKNMPQGLDTIVGPSGSAMSGGQRQRVALARARLRDAPVLILDEATSALDHTTRSVVMEQIRKWRAGKTTIIITHNISQILRDDYVYEMNQGTIVQKGIRHSLEDFGTIRQADGTGTTSLSEANHAITKPYRDEIPTTAAVQPDEKGGPISSCWPYEKSPYASPSFASPEDIEMRPWSSHSGFSKLDDLEAYENLSTSSTLMTELPQYQRTSIKAKSSAGEGQIVSLKEIFLTVWPSLPVSKRVALCLGFTAALLHAAATPAFSYIFSQLLSTFYLPTANARSDHAYIYSLSILGVAAIDSIASYLMHYLLESCGQHWVDLLRIRAYRNILDQPMAFFFLDENKVEKLTETLDRNAEETRNLLSRFAALLFVAVSMMAIAVTFSLVLSWRLTLVGLACAPFLCGMTRGFEYVSGWWEARSNDSASSANAIFAETFSNIRSVRAFTLEDHFRRQHTKAITSTFNIGLQRAIYSGIFFGLSDTGIIFVTALIFYYGAQLVSSGTQSVTEILTVFTTLLFSIANVNSIVAFIPQISSSRATATSLLRLASLPYQASHESSGTHRPSTITSIEFRNTTFAYPSRPTAPVLRSFSLKIDPTTSTALTGPSGSGKSTITSLLLALYPAPSTCNNSESSSSIYINSLPLPQIDTATLRSLIALVPQTPTLFPISIAGNVTYPDPPPPSSSHQSQQQLLNLNAALEAAQLHTFISTLPSGIHTLLAGTTGTASSTGAGTTLSGGQTQRLALARALYRRPRFLVLDEVTSGLDKGLVREMAGVVRGYGVRGEGEGEGGDNRGRGCLVVTHDEYDAEGEDEGMRGACRVVVELDGGLTWTGG